MKIKSIFTVCAAFVLITACNKKSDNLVQGKDAGNCQSEIRGGFDFGSGSTKLKIAQVKFCKDGNSTVEKVYFSKNKEVKYGADVKDRLHPGVFSDKIIAEGVNAAKDLLKEANAQFVKDKTCGEEACKVVAWRGIMTQAFREAKNWTKAKSELEKAVNGLIIKRLSQDEEALFGFYPVTLINGFDKSNSVVWDMGGSSTQITAFTAEFDPKRFSVEKGVHIIKTPIGSSLAKQAINHFGITEINPIAEQGVDIEEFYATTIAANLAPEFNKYAGNFTNLFVNNKKYYVIGGILSRSIPSAIKDYTVYQANTLSNINLVKPISRTEIIEQYGNIRSLDTTALSEYAELNYQIKKDASGKLPASVADYASNMLVTLNYMDTDLQIKDIYPILIDGTDTIIITPEFKHEEYWKNDANTKK